MEDCELGKAYTSQARMAKGGVEVACAQSLQHNWARNSVLLRRAIFVDSLAGGTRSWREETVSEKWLLPQSLRTLMTRAFGQGLLLHCQSDLPPHPFRNPPCRVQLDLNAA